MQEASSFDAALSALRRQRTYLAAPILAGLVLGVVVAFLWPDTFLSTATLRVTSSRLSDKVAPRVFNDQLNHQLNQLANEVLSRTSLASLIQTHSLYARQQSRRPLEDVIEEMRRNIRLAPVNSLRAANSPTAERVAALQVQFAYADRRLAQRVCADLSSSLIQASLRWRVDETGSAKLLFENEVHRWRQRLAEIDSALASAADPAQQNELQRRQWVTLESRIAELRRDLAHLRHETESAAARQATLRRQLDTLPAQQATPAAPPPPSPALLAYQRAEQNLAALRLRYRGDHPDLLEAQRLADAAKSQLPNEPATTTTPGPAPNRERLILDAELAGLDAAQTSRQRQQRDLETQLATTQATLAALPAGPSAEPAATRQFRDERRTAQDALDKATHNLNLAEADRNIDTHGHGERFELLDPANLPEKATEPDRLLLAAAGLALGLLTGLSIATIRELRDHSLKDIIHVQQSTGHTVLASIPLLENDLVLRRRLRLQWLAWTTACLSGVLLMGGSVLYHFSQ